MVAIASTEPVSSNTIEIYILKDNYNFGAINAEALDNLSRANKAAMTQDQRADLAPACWRKITEITSTADPSVI